MSSGEKLDTLTVFHPERMAQRILGMGDITSLVEKAQSQFDEAEAKKLEKRIIIIKITGTSNHNFNMFLTDCLIQLISFFVNASL